MKQANRPFFGCVLHFFTMQVVILAAGRGKRMGALTETVPKPLLTIHGKTALEHKLERLPKGVTEIIFVIGYLGEQIRAALGDSYRGIPIRYVEQKELLGTAHSLWQAKEFLHGKFMVLMGDDVYSENDLARLSEHEWAILVRKVPALVRGGKVILENGKLKDVVEGDAHGGVESLVNTGVYMLQPALFQYAMVKVPGREEYGLPQTILQVVNDFDIGVVEAEEWLELTDPNDIQKMEQHLHKK